MSGSLKCNGAVLTTSGDSERPTGRRHLDAVLRTYTEHYNCGRAHRALALATPVTEDQASVAVSPRDVRGHDMLGGLIHEWGGLAA
jgi:hypothetical protein